MASSRQKFYYKMPINLKSLISCCTKIPQRLSLEKSSTKNIFYIKIQKLVPKNTEKAATTQIFVPNQPQYEKNVNFKSKRSNKKIFSTKIFSTKWPVRQTLHYKISINFNSVPSGV